MGYDKEGKRKKNGFGEELRWERKKEQRSFSFVRFVVIKILILGVRKKSSRILWTKFYIVKISFFLPHSSLLPSFSFPFFLFSSSSRKKGGHKTCAREETKGKGKKGARNWKSTLANSAKNGSSSSSSLPLNNDDEKKEEQTFFFHSKNFIHFHPAVTTTSRTTAQQGTKKLQQRVFLSLSLRLIRLFLDNDCVVKVWFFPLFRRTLNRFRERERTQWPGKEKKRTAPQKCPLSSFHHPHRRRKKKRKKTWGIESRAREWTKGKRTSLLPVRMIEIFTVLLFFRCKKMKFRRDKRTRATWRKRKLPLILLVLTEKDRKTSLSFVSSFSPSHTPISPQTATAFSSASFPRALFVWEEENCLQHHHHQE